MGVLSLSKLRPWTSLFCQIFISFEQQQHSDTKEGVYFQEGKGFYRTNQFQDQMTNQISKIIQVVVGNWLYFNDWVVTLYNNSDRKEDILKFQEQSTNHGKMHFEAFKNKLLVF